MAKVSYREGEIVYCMKCGVKIVLGKNFTEEEYYSCGMCRSCQDEELGKDINDMIETMDTLKAISCSIDKVNETLDLIYKEVKRKGR